MEENIKANNEDPAWTTDEFRIYEYKVKRCSRSRPHDWTQCPFSHSGEKAKRRDPRRFAYTGAACPDYRKNASCRRGDKCPFAHGVFESWLHPSRYRTQCCTDGVACKRRVCFFAHQESELRKPEDDPGLLAAQLQAEALASTEAYQQILASASLDTVPEAAPANNPAPQLNLAILQTLLQNAGAAQRPPISWPGDNDTQERTRIYQLQALLAALQLRAPTPPPPQPSQSDLLGSLDKAELGRLLAANQALVQQQAEHEMLQRSSFEAARRTSMSSEVGPPPLIDGLNAFRHDSFMGPSGGMQYGADFGQTEGRGNARQGVRRMSMDNAGTSSQSLDPRILAALAAQRMNAGGGQPQGRQSAAFRRSVDMGMLAHAASLGAQQGSNPGMEEGRQPMQEASAFANAFSQGAMQAEAVQARRQGSSFLGQQGMELAPADQAALNASLDGMSFQRAPSAYGQINGQLQDGRRYSDQLARPASGQLSGQASGQPGSLGQLSGQGSGHFGQGLSAQSSAAHLGSYAQFLSQGSGSLGQSLQGQASGHFSDMHGHPGHPVFSPGGHSLSSADSLGRLSDMQQQQMAQIGDAIDASGGWASPPEAVEFQQQQQGGVYQGYGGGERGGQGSSTASLQLPQPEDNPRNGDDPFSASGNSTPSCGANTLRGPPTPGTQRAVVQRMTSPRERPPSAHSSIYSPASHTTTYEHSPRSAGLSMGLNGQPSIPEEGPGGWAAAAGRIQPPPASAASAAAEAAAAEARRARMMPTLLEQLELFERQRRSSLSLLDAQPPLSAARNTSFESLSAELPRSISDLNLADHSLNSARMAPGIPASSN